jgi:hypothetical protein
MLTGRPSRKPPGLQLSRAPGCRRACRADGHLQRGVRHGPDWRDDLFASTFGKFALEGRETAEDNVREAA